MMGKLKLSILIFHILLSGYMLAQETNSRAMGQVLDSKQLPLPYVHVELLHIPTNEKFYTITNKDGIFYFLNIRPGGPYSMSFTAAEFQLKNSVKFIYQS